MNSTERDAYTASTTYTAAYAAAQQAYNAGASDDDAYNAAQAAAYATQGRTCRATNAAYEATCAARNAQQ